MPTFELIEESANLVPQEVFLREHGLLTREEERLAAMGAAR
jgi:hypothetical protein